MAENKVKYYVRIDNKYVEADMKTAQSKVSNSGSLVTSAIAGIGKASAAALGATTVAAVKFGTDFETSMAKASTLIDTQTTDMSKLSDQMLDLSDSTGIAASELGNTMYNALSSGIKLGENNENMISALESSAKLAKAGFTDIDTALSATAKTMNAYGLEGEKAMSKVQTVLMQTQNNGITTVGELGSVLSNVTPTAAALGVSFEQVGASIANMTAQGTATGAATTQLNGLIAELAKNGQVASDILKEKTGKSFTTLMEEGKTLSDVLNIMTADMSKNSKAISNMMSKTNETTGLNYSFEESLEKLGLTAEDVDGELLNMFGSVEAGKAALALSGENSAKFTENLAAMSTETDVVGNAFDKVTGTSAERFAKMLNELKNAAIELFSNLQPFIAEAMPILQEGLTLLLEPLTEMSTDLVPLLGNAFLDLLPALTPLISELLPILVSLLEMIIPFVSEFASQILPVLVQVLDAIIPLVSIILELLAPLLSLFIALLAPVLDLIAQGLVPLIEVMAKLMDAILPVLIGCIENLKESMTRIFESIGTMVLGWVEMWICVLENLMEFIQNVFTGNWSSAWQNIKNIFTAIVDGIVSSFKNGINVLIDAINGFLGGLNGISIPDWVPGVGGLRFYMPQIPRLKTGIDFVPSDYFPAYLDYGERVLTQEENAALNAMGGMSAVERNLSTGGQSAPTQSAYIRGGGNQNVKVTGETKVVLECDGRELARASAPYMGEQMEFEDF